MKCRHCQQRPCCLKSRRAPALCFACSRDPALRARYTKATPTCTVPLTEPQRRLASDPRYLKLAESIASAYARRCPGQRSEILSAAHLGLCLAARNWRPGRGTQFATFAHLKIVGAIIDAARQMMPAGFRRASSPARQAGRDLPQIDSLSRVLLEIDRGVQELGDTIPAGELPVGWEIESLDELEALARKLPPTHAQCVRLYYGCAGAVMKRIGRRVGLSESRVSQILAEVPRLLEEAS